jgi:hypothetical protein
LDLDLLRSPHLLLGIQSMATATTTATATSAARVSPQGGILEGGNPTVYDSKNPLVLFIIQVILLFFCSLGLSTPFL